MNRSKRSSLNKKKGNAFENKIVKIFKENFPDYKFQRVPNSRDFEFLDIKGDLIISQDFPHTQIECRYRMFIASRDMKRFFEKFEKSDFGRWFYECKEKFGKKPWIIVFKIGRGEIYTIIKSKLRGIKSYIKNEQCFVYLFRNYIEWLRKKMSIEEE